MTPDRERDLLEANNRYLEDARAARKERDRVKAINAMLMGDDEDAPRYTTGRLRYEVKKRLEEAAFQPRVDPWLIACFGEEIARDRQERSHRFLEESLELVQAAGATASEAHQLVDYVFGRPAGDLAQESGGVSVTHAALCLAHGIDMAEAAERELARIWTKVDQIRAKQAAKPKHSPLPEHVGARWTPTHRHATGMSVEYVGALAGQGQIFRTVNGQLMIASFAESGTLFRAIEPHTPTAPLQADRPSEAPAGGQAPAGAEQPARQS